MCMCSASGFLSLNGLLTDPRPRPFLLNLKNHPLRSAAHVVLAAPFHSQGNISYKLCTLALQYCCEEEEALVTQAADFYQRSRHNT